MSARVWVFLAITLSLVGERPASAQSDSARDALELDWSAPEGCPDGEHIRAEVQRLAGAQTRPTRHLKAHASLRPDERNAWILNLTTELDGMKGERNLSGISCQSLGEAAALTLALIVNPDAKIEGPSETAEPAPPSPKIDKPWPRPILHLGALAGLQSGVLEELSPWFALSLGIALDRFSARLLPGFTPPQRISSQDRQDSGGRLWLFSAAALGCFDVIRGPVLLSPCAGVDVVRLQGRGWGVLHVREATVYWTSAELAVLAGLPLGRLVTFELWGVGLVPLYKSSVYLDEAGRISRPSSFGFKALAGFDVAFR